MNFLINSVVYSAPLLLATAGALVSEYAGCMALFLDGVINLGAFLCFLLTVTCHSRIAGCILSLMLCVLFFAGASLLAERIHANRFLASLALNLIANALVSLVSFLVFGTRGTLTSPLFQFPPETARIETSIAAFIFCTALLLFLFLTKDGLYLRITGTDSAVLQAQGITPARLRTLSWIIAAFSAAAAGCILSIRLSSFVPNVASGRGWIALAAVFLGKKKTAAVASAVFLFCAAEYAANSFSLFQNMSSAVIIALPYLTALLLIVIFPEK